jgi:beta-glucosidase
MMGSALAEILFGKVSPSGKIAETFPMSIKDTPSYESYPGDGYDSKYSEGILVGYRHYDYFKKDVLFPFGFGLSYSKFEYSGINIMDLENGNIKVSFSIKNVGKMDAKETAQVYIKHINSKVLKAPKELKAFKKLSLSPNEEKIVEITLERDAFSYFNTDKNEWTIDSGTYEIMIGASVADIRLTKEIIID